MNAFLITTVIKSCLHEILGYKAGARVHEVCRVALPFRAEAEIGIRDQDSIKGKG